MGHLDTSSLSTVDKKIYCERQTYRRPVDIKET